MLAYDVFTDDAFSVAEMREMVDDLTYIPDELNRMGIFTADPIRTTTVMIGRSKESLTLVPITERGSQRTRLERDERNLIGLSTVALRQEDRINSQSLQNIAPEGTPYDAALSGALDEVEKRNRKMMRKLELTREFHRMAAIQGYVIDADGSISRDVYDDFGITRPAAVVINPALVEGNLRKAIYAGITRPLTETLNRSSRNAPRGIVALCGDDFFDALITAPEIRETYLNTAQAQDLRQGFVPYEAFNYAGVRWMNYRGTNDGTTIAIPTDECVFIPTGVEDMFAEFRSPGEDFAHINKPGAEFYSVVSPDNRINRTEYVDVTLDAYPLFVCLVLEGLLRGTLP
ncbi:MAG: major capsid protein [Pseudomonadota bacterium]